MRSGGIEGRRQKIESRRQEVESGVLSPPQNCHPELVSGSLFSVLLILEEIFSYVY